MVLTDVFLEFYITMDDLQTQIPEIKHNFSGTTAESLLIAVVPGRSGQGKSIFIKIGHDY